MKSFIEVQAREEKLGINVKNTMISLDDISAFQPCDNETLVFMRDVNLIVSMKYEKFKKIIVEEKTAEVIEINDLGKLPWTSE